MVEKRVLQVNVENGGVLSLVSAVNKKINKEVKFDYFSMAAYSKNTIYYELESLGSNMYNPKPRNNRCADEI